MNAVSLDFNPYFFGPAGLHVLAFDASNGILGTFDFATGPVTADINTTANIDHLLLAAHPDQVSSTFDNFTIDNLSFGVAAVPEPSTWAMMLLGLAGCGLVGYRRRRGSGWRAS